MLFHLEQLQERIKGLETELASGLTALETKLDDLKKQMSLATPAQPVPEKPQKADTPKKKASVPAKKPRVAAKTETVKSPPKASPASQNRMFHTVAAGETLYRISIKYGVSVDELKRANPAVVGNTIHTGQALLIPME